MKFNFTKFLQFFPNFTAHCDPVKLSHFRKKKITFHTLTLLEPHRKIDFMDFYNAAKFAAATAMKF